MERPDALKQVLHESGRAQVREEALVELVSVGSNRYELSNIAERSILKRLRRLKVRPGLSDPGEPVEVRQRQARVLQLALQVARGWRKLAG